MSAALTGRTLVVALTHKAIWAVRLRRGDPIVRRAGLYTTEPDSTSKQKRPVPTDFESLEPGAGPSFIDRSQ